MCIEFPWWMGLAAIGVGAAASAALAWLATRPGRGCTPAPVEDREQIDTWGFK